MNIISKKFYPDNKAVLKNFKTKEYQFNYLDNMAELKIVIITSIRPERGEFTPEEALFSINTSYLNQVKKNYFYKVKSVIRIPKFQEEVKNVIQKLDLKWYNINITDMHNRLNKMMNSNTDS